MNLFTYYSSQQKKKYRQHTYKLNINNGEEDDVLNV